MQIDISLMMIQTNANLKIV
ncbi:Protein of unknown function [Lactobacillus delbrueckii subsp. bulgaricus]|nr:Protein of unknown function [Lactobacillus delbrueckii subsp. bulgaricus]